MPQLLSRLPQHTHARIANLLAAAVGVVAVVAFFLLMIFLETTETTGHLWWKETRTLSYEERRPYLIGFMACVVGAIVLGVGALELWIARIRRSRYNRDCQRAWAHAQWVWEASPAGRAHREAAEAEAEAAEAEAEAAEADWRWRQSIEGQATMAYDRGDQFFSIELVVDASIAEKLNAVYRAGWREKSVGKRHEKSKTSTPSYDGGHYVESGSTEFRTYLFERA